MTPRPCRATAHSNIALVKYWGKRDGRVPDLNRGSKVGCPEDPAKQAACEAGGYDLNLPAVGSLSMTLEQLRSETNIEPARRDTFTLDAQLLDGKPASKVFEQLDRIWRLGGCEGVRPRCAVDSVNHLPTAAGLASSASGFAALTLAAAGCFGLARELDVATCTRLSSWARMGSGSAARSLWGGFVRLDAGTANDGNDCVARQLFDAGHWDVRLLVVHTARGAKAVASTGGMESSRLTSPYYDAWVSTAAADLDAAEQALGERAFERLGDVMEHSCFKMHACMLATRPPLVYWNGTTLEVIRAVWRLRETDGPRGFVTSDAGPHVKVLCRAPDAAALAESLTAVPGVHEVQIVAPGPGPSLELG